MKNKIFLVLSIIFFILSFFIFKHHFSVFYFQNDINKIAVNIEVNSPKDKMLICFNDNCDNLKYKNNIYSYKLNQENPLFYKSAVNKIEIISEESNLIENIKAISIFNASNLIYYSKDDIKNISKKEIEINSQTKYAYDLKFNSTNNKPFYQKISIYFLSLFYNWYFYIFGYAFLILFIVKNKENFRFKIKNPYIYLSVITLLALFLRLSHINYIPFWNDELYVLETIFQDKFQFKRMFLDPGNPPLFYFLSSFWLSVFNKDIVLDRLLPTLIGTVQIVSIFYLTKNILNKNIALMTSFLCSINIYLICESNDFRSYILTMTLVLFGAYYFYKLHKNFSSKNLVKYFIFSIALINVHFYGLIYILSNFILGLFTLKNKLKFICVNLISFLTIIPYLLFVYKKSLNPAFNAWLEKPSGELIDSHIVFYFGNIFFLLFALYLFLYLFKKDLLEKEEKAIIKYFTFTIVFTFVFAFIVSFLVKPILFERYFSIFMPLSMILFAILLDKAIKNNIIIFAIILFFGINMPKYENFNLFSNINQTIKYSTHDYKNYPDEQNIYFIVPDMIDYINYFKNDFKNISKNNILISNFGSREDKDLILEYKKMAKKESNLIFYVPEICVNSEIKYRKNPNIQKIETTIVPIYKITIP